MKIQNGTLPLVVLAAMMMVWGCDNSTSSHQGAEVVMLGGLMESVSYNWEAEDIIYLARLKNEGDLPAFQIQMWVTCYDTYWGEAVWMVTASSISPDTLYPGLSRWFNVDIGWSSEGGPESHGWGIDSVVTDIEWRE